MDTLVHPDDDIPESEKEMSDTKQIDVEERFARLTESMGDWMAQHTVHGTVTDMYCHVMDRPGYGDRSDCKATVKQSDGITVTISLSIDDDNNV